MTNDNQNVLSLDAFRKKPEEALRYENFQIGIDKHDQIADMYISAAPEDNLEEAHVRWMLDKCKQMQLWMMNHLSWLSKDKPLEYPEQDILVMITMYRSGRVHVHWDADTVDMDLPEQASWVRRMCARAMNIMRGV